MYNRYYISGWWLTYPSENMGSSVVHLIPNIWKFSKKWSKPPTRVTFETTNQIWSCILWEFNIAIENNHCLMGKPSISMGHFQYPVAVTAW